MTRSTASNALTAVAAARATIAALTAATSATASSAPTVTPSAATTPTAVVAAPAALAAPHAAAAPASSSSTAAAPDTASAAQGGGSSAAGGAGGAGAGGAAAAPIASAPPLGARLAAHPLARPLGALIVLLLINLFAVPGFFHLEVKDGHLYGAMVDILNRAAPLMLAATGMTIVIAMRGIDISVGAVVALAAAVACTMAAAEQPLWLAFAAALGAALLCGVWNGLLVASLGLQPIVATLVLMVAGRGLAQLVTDGQIITVYRDDFFVLGSGYLLGLPVALYVALAVVATVALAMRKTALGLFTQAVGINPVAARLAGIRAGALVFASYAFCAVCAGLAGLIISSNIKSADANNAGLLLELDAILAVTLGGTSLAGGKFNLAGSVIGALIIQTLTYTVYSLGVPPEVNLVVKSLVVFAVCLSQRSKA